uniref:CSON010733 protein n=1 Tax=Culicoides sonorensis TaxID=179676 RepID=A0A336N460_CULSO
MQCNAMQYNAKQDKTIKFLRSREEKKFASSIETVSRNVCMRRIIECVYKGVTYSSGTEWSSPDDPCKHFKCLAGVITESDLQCYTPCSSPQLPKEGQCCPTCDVNT